MEKEIFDAVSETVNQNLEQFYGLRTIKPEDNLTDLGINSMAFIKIMISLEERFGIEITDDDTEVSNYITVEDIVKAIEAKIKQISK